MSNSNFDNLAQLALNEGTLQDYMNAVKRANKATTVDKNLGKSVIKSAIKGAAQLPGRAIQTAGAGLRGLGTVARGVGAVYSALGGKQGGSALQNIGGKVSKAGSTVSAAGQKIAAAPEKLHRTITRYGRGYEGEGEMQEFIKKYKQAVLDKYKLGMPGAVKRSVEGSKSYEEINSTIRKGMPGVSSAALQAVANSVYTADQGTVSTTNITPTQPAPVFKPKLKANRSMVKDTQSGIVYRYLGRDQGGWYIYDPLTKKTDPTPIDPRDQKNVAALWRKKEIANNAAKQQAK